MMLSVTETAVGPQSVVRPRRPAIAVMPGVGAQVWGFVVRSADGGPVWCSGSQQRVCWCRAPVALW